MVLMLPEEKPCGYYTSASVIICQTRRIDKFSTVLEFCDLKFNLFCIQIKIIKAYSKLLFKTNLPSVNKNICRNSKKGLAVEFKERSY